MSNLSSTLTDEELKRQLMIYAQALKNTGDLLGSEVVYEKLGGSLVVVIRDVYEEGK